MKTSSFSFIILIVMLLGCQKIEVASNNEASIDCVEKANGNVACTKEYAPVCGCNNKTYGNACEAKSMGIMNYTQGECKK
jgi:hypothetical protein